MSDKIDFYKVEKKIEKSDQEQLAEPNKPKAEQSKKTSPSPPKTPTKTKVSSIEETLNSLLEKTPTFEEFEKLEIIQGILKYTKTQMALNTCGEILKGKSLKRATKKKIGAEVISLINKII